MSPHFILEFKTEGQTAAQPGPARPGPQVGLRTRAPGRPALTSSLLQLGKGLLPPPLGDLPPWENSCKSSERSHTLSFCLMQKSQASQQKARNSREQDLGSKAAVLQGPSLLPGAQKPLCSALPPTAAACAWPGALGLWGFIRSQERGHLLWRRRGTPHRWRFPS